MVSCTEPTMSVLPCSLTRRSRNAMTSSKLCPVSTCSTWNGSGAGRNAFSANRSRDDGILTGGEQQHRFGEFGDDLADDVDGFGFQQPQLIDVGRVMGGVQCGTHTGSPSFSASTR